MVFDARPDVREPLRSGMKSKPTCGIDDLLAADDEEADHTSSMVALPTPISEGAACGRAADPPDGLAAAERATLPASREDQPNAVDQTIPPPTAVAPPSESSQIRHSGADGAPPSGDAAAPQRDSAAPLAAAVAAAAPSEPPRAVTASPSASAPPAAGSTPLSAAAAAPFAASAAALGSGGSKRSSCSGGKKCGSPRFLSVADSKLQHSLSA